MFLCYATQAAFPPHYVRILFSANLLMLDTARQDRLASPLMARGTNIQLLSMYSLFERRASEKRQHRPLPAYVDTQHRF